MTKFLFYRPSIQISNSFRLKQNIYYVCSFPFLSAHSSARPPGTAVNALIPTLCVYHLFSAPIMADPHQHLPSLKVITDSRSYWALARENSVSAHTSWLRRRETTRPRALRSGNKDDTHWKASEVLPHTQLRLAFTVRSRGGNLRIHLCFYLQLPSCPISLCVSHPRSLKSTRIRFRPLAICLCQTLISSLVPSFGNSKSELNTVFRPRLPATPPLRTFLSSRFSVRREIGQ